MKDSGFHTGQMRGCARWACERNGALTGVFGVRESMIISACSRQLAGKNSVRAATISHLSYGVLLIFIC
jgi:hypothetical protein